MEGGTAGMLTSSGQAANFYAIFNIANAGDHVVSSASIYGGTFNLFNVTMRKMGIEFTFVSPDCTEEELEAARQRCVDEFEKIVVGSKEGYERLQANRRNVLEFSDRDL